MWDNSVIWIFIGFVCGIIAVFVGILVTMLLPDFLEDRMKNQEIKRLLKRAEDIDKMSK
jgi:hypothetical protein